MKSSTNLTSAAFALAATPRTARYKQWLFAAAAAISLASYALYGNIGAPVRTEPGGTGQDGATTPAANVKWRYDEMAHKLIMENAGLAYSEPEPEPDFTVSIGRTLGKVSRQIDGKPVILNL